METKFKPFDKVLVRNNRNSEWEINFFGYYKEEMLLPFYCASDFFKYCIPYEGNEHLLGTTDDYVEPFEPKDGDFVKVIFKDNVNYLIGIFKHFLTQSLDTNADKSVRLYCTLSPNYVLEPYGDIWECSSIDHIEVAPDTSKQALLDSLHKEGKDWDAEKKEIVDYKWKPKEGENYFTPVVYQTEFEVRESVWNGNAIEEDFFFKGWVFQTKEECQTFCNKLNVAINKIK